MASRPPARPRQSVAGTARASIHNKNIIFAATRLQTKETTRQSSRACTPKTQETQLPSTRSQHFNRQTSRQDRDEILAPKKSLILCFDGTRNKFQGSAADSNILKIYSMLDKEDPHLFRYYQPGIGTYVETSSLSKKSRAGRIKSWYTKAKDQAIGTSFGEHVMAGYKFLMRYHTAGDNIYFFG
jgi:uncharacterized protein (DUF2235 family)